LKISEVGFRDPQSAAVVGGTERCEVTASQASGSPHRPGAA
jgi:hypothetical protein